MILLAGDIGVVTSYAGRWMVTLGISDTLGKFSSDSEIAMVAGRLTVPFSAPQYVQGTEAVTVELCERPGAVTRRLARRLLRGLGVGTDSTTTRYPNAGQVFSGSGSVSSESLRR